MVAVLVTVPVLDLDFQTWFCPTPNTKYPHRIIPGIESRAGDKYAMDVDVDVG